MLKGSPDSSESVEREASLNVATMTRVALMAAVTAVAAQIAIPLPFSPVPFTLQVPAHSPRRRALTVGSLWGVAALAVIYAIGAGWLSVVTDLPLAVAVAQGVL